MFLLILGRLSQRYHPCRFALLRPGAGDDFAIEQPVGDPAILSIIVPIVIAFDADALEKPRGVGEVEPVLRQIALALGGIEADDHGIYVAAKVGRRNYVAAEFRAGLRYSLPWVPVEVPLRWEAANPRFTQNPYIAPGPPKSYFRGRRCFAGPLSLTGPRQSTTLMG